MSGVGVLYLVCWACTMPRPPRLQFPGAIYHIVTRGDGRRAVFCDGGHYARFTNGLADEVQRSAWDVIAYCWIRQYAQIHIGQLSSVFSMIRSKASKSASFKNRRVRRTPRFRTWNTIPRGATRAVRGISTNYPKLPRLSIIRPVPFNCFRQPSRPIASDNGTHSSMILRAPSRISVLSVG